VNEDHKIEEAQYFLTKLANPELELREFSFELSAFLTAARSALQYALEEARSKSGGQAWDDTQIGASPAVKHTIGDRPQFTPLIPHPDSSLYGSQTLLPRRALLYVQA